MKRITKVLLLPLLTVLLCYPFSFVNVNAGIDVTYYEVPTASMPAYIFFANYGLTFNDNFYTTNTTTTSKYNYGAIYDKGNGIYTFHAVGVNGNLSANGVQYITETMTSYDQSQTRLSYNEMRGTLNTYTAYNSNNTIRIEPNQTFILAFYGNRATDVISWYTSKGVGVLNYSIQRTSQFGSGDYRYWHKQVIIMENVGNEWDYFTLNFNFNNVNNYICVPLYFGAKEFLPDDYAQELGLETSVERGLRELKEVFTSGNENSENAITNNNTINNNFNDASNDYHDAETDALTDFNSALQNVDQENPLINNNGFLNASNFVAMTFNRIINDDDSNAIRSIIVLSLLLGIALTIIGKLRNN